MLHEQSATCSSLKLTCISPALLAVYVFMLGRMLRQCKNNECRHIKYARAARRPCEFMRFIYLVTARPPPPWARFQPLKGMHRMRSPHRAYWRHMSFRESTAHDETGIRLWNSQKLTSEPIICAFITVNPWTLMMNWNPNPASLSFSSLAYNCMHRPYRA